MSPRLPPDDHEIATSGFNRMSRIEKFVKFSREILVVVLCIFLSVMLVVATNRIGTVETLLHRQTCIAKLNGKPWGAFVGILKNPADQEARAKANVDLVKAATALQHASTVCK